MEEICKICQNPIVDKHLWTAHKIKQSQYYPKFYPRRDLLTGETIPFEDKLQYFSTYFVSKRNLNQWVNNAPKKEVENFCKEILVFRKNEKSLIWAMSQVELRSLGLPGAITFNKVFGDYYQLVESLGFRNKFIYFDEKLNWKINHSLTAFPIIIDSRESKPLRFRHPTQVTKLEFGDYTLSNPVNKVFIERKGLADLIQTLSVGYERFESEICRAVMSDSYLIVLVEEKLSNALTFNFLPWISNKIRAKPSFIFHRVRELIQKYSNIQFLFVDGRKTAANIVSNILFTNDLPKQIDLQLAYDMGVLK